MPRGSALQLLLLAILDVLDQRADRLLKAGKRERRRPLDRRASCDHDVFVMQGSRPGPGDLEGIASGKKEQKPELPGLVRDQRRRAGDDTRQHDAAGSDPPQQG
jgi:hypothetical protein